MTCNEPGADQTQKKQGQHHTRHEAAHSLDLVPLTVLHLRLNADERVLHLGAIEPDLQSAYGLRGGTLAGDDALQNERSASRFILDRITAGEQNAIASVPNLDPLDVALLEQPLSDRRNRRFVARAQRGGQRYARDLAQTVGPGFQIRFELLFNRRMGKLVDVGRVDAMLVIGKAGQQKRERRADQQGHQQILRFEAACHHTFFQPAKSLH